MSSDLEKLAPFEARAIIEALRKGTVPVEHVQNFSVGREQWMRFIQDDLDSYIAEGGAKVRFINGDYGDGKTHFMSLIRHLAQASGFAVSMVVLSREVPIQRFESIYQTLVQQLRGKFEGAGIRACVSQWMLGQTEMDEAKRVALVDTLRGLEGLDTGFANALAALVDLHHAPLREGESAESRHQARESLYLWLEGGRVSKKELKAFQVFEVLNKTNAKRFLTSLIRFLRFAGHKGLVLLIDELETVVSQAAGVRSAAYENVRLLIDNSEQAGHLHIFFSVIPDVLLSEKGFKSYDALWSRVRTVGEGKKLNYRGILIDLHRTPLEVPELVELGGRLRRIHEISYRWQSGDLFPDSLLEKLCATQKRAGLLSEVRLYIKQVVRLLDMAEQGEPPSAELDLGEHLVASQREVEQEKAKALQPTWDS